MRKTHFLMFAFGLSLVLSACSSGGGTRRLFDGGTFDFAKGDGPHTTGEDGGAGGCSDGIKDGKETDVDCGGGTCPACAGDRHCLVPSDCQSNTCTAGLCVLATSCSNGIKDGNETDVDCGGGACNPCPSGYHCQGPSDCQTNTCTNGTCSSGSSCFDGIKNGSETDIDCGGSCSPCATGSSCFNTSDCSSSNCSNQVCCDTGTANCDFSKSNGCEVNLMTDSANCNTCGNPCAQGQTCQNGQCTTSSSMCGQGTCSGSPCASNTGPLSTGCDPNGCVAAVCGADSYCCSNVWDSQCVSEVATYCTCKCM